MIVGQRKANKRAERPINPDRGNDGDDPTVDPMAYGWSPVTANRHGACAPTIHSQANTGSVQSAGIREPELTRTDSKQRVSAKI